VASGPVADFGPERLAQAMIGAQRARALPVRDESVAAGEPVLSVERLSVSNDAGRRAVREMSFSLRAGEILGVAGVSGNGQRELLYALSGEDTRAPSDSIRLGGQAVGSRGPAQRRALGLHFVPDERLGRGAVPSLSLAHNLLLTRSDSVSASGWIDMTALAQQAQAIISEYKVKAGGPNAAAQSLSGGNLQKFIVGREINAAPKLLIVSQPTWGVDVGAAAQIRTALLALRDAGCAVLVVSEELDELFELCDRMHVIAQGRLSASLSREQATVAQIGSWMSGLWSASEETVN
jgi:simple sugar transport system ATP-binding protein